MAVLKPTTLSYSWLWIWKKLWDFVTLRLEISDKAKLLFHKIVLHCCLETARFKAKNQAPIQISHGFFLIPWKSTPFLWTPGILTYCFLNNHSVNSIASIPDPHQYHEKILFAQLFFLQFSLERQDNYLQDFLLRKKEIFNRKAKAKFCFCWDINWWIRRKPRYRTRSHSCDDEVGIKLFNKDSHKIVQNETESFLKKDQVWTPIFSFMLSSQLFGFTSNLFMKLK